MTSLKQILTQEQKIQQEKNNLDKLTKKIKTMKRLEKAFITGAALGAAFYITGEVMDQDKLSAISLGTLLFSTLFGFSAGYRVDELEEKAKYFQNNQINNNYKIK